VTELVVAATASELARQAANWLALELARAIDANGSGTLGLAGGRTPEPAYRELASDPRIPWSQVDVFFTDERAVPPDDPESNYHMVDRALLSRVPIPEGRVHRMEAERRDRDAAALEYARALPPRLDVLLLGLGADGHTASLFPGAGALDERDRLVVPVVGPKPPGERLTITPPVIEAARKLAVIAAGADKADMVARALEGPVTPSAVPATLARRGVWFLDRTAASRLRLGGTAP
jgi:6-phosphogluconolactonase